MSGIPVYSQSPINAAQKPSAITPQTALPASQASNASAPTPTSATSTSTASYQSAQPGASIPPAPTGAAAQRYAPLVPTPTTKTEAYDGPAPPQPGQVPAMSNISSSPKAGEQYRPRQQTPVPTISSKMPQPYPPQMAIPPPTTAFGIQPHKSTHISNTASSSYPVALPFSDDGAPRRSLEHPPGYHQNVYASDLSSEQRRAMEASNNNASRGSSERMGGEESDGVWNTLGKMAQQAGAKIAETESSIWRSINKE